MKKLMAAVLSVLMLASAFTMFASAGLTATDSDVIAKATPTVDGKIDDVYLQGLAVKLGPPKYAGKEINNTAEVYALYDDNYVYVAAYVTNDEFYEVDLAYLESDAHPSNNDAFEIRIGTNGHMAPYTGTNKDHHLFYVDAQDRRYSSYQEQVDGFYGKTTVGDKYYIVEVAIPLESSLVEGESIFFNFQVDDMTPDGMGAIGIASSYNKLVEFKVGGAVETTTTDDTTNDDTTNGDTTTDNNTPTTPTAPTTFDSTIVVLAALALCVVALVAYKKVSSK